MALVLVGLVVVPEDTVVFTQRHLFHNMGQHFESFSQTKPRSFTKPHKTFTKPLTTFEILTILCGLVEIGPNRVLGRVWGVKARAVVLHCDPLQGTTCCNAQSPP